MSTGHFPCVIVGKCEPRFITLARLMMMIIIIISCQMIDAWDPCALIKIQNADVRTLFV